MKEVVIEYRKENLMMATVVYRWWSGVAILMEMAALGGDVDHIVLKKNNI